MKQAAEKIENLRLLGGQNRSDLSDRFFPDPLTFGACLFAGEGAIYQALDQSRLTLLGLCLNRFNLADLIGAQTENYRQMFDPRLRASATVAAATKALVLGNCPVGASGSPR